MLEVVLYGVRGMIFTATLDLYQFRTSAHILLCLHVPGPGRIVRPSRASSSQQRIGLSTRFTEPIQNSSERKKKEKKRNKKSSAGEKFSICKSCCTPAALLAVRADFTILPSL